ncbi:unnamed protein product [Discosporangium mesarthrocarpum]
MEWDSDSELILCALYKRSLVEVFSLSRPDWHCRIREGMAGMVRAQWTPDSRHVLTFADFNLHLSVWSLTTRQMRTVRQPKAPPGCMAFSPDSRMLALITRKECRDYVRLYDASTWEALSEFSVETLDATSLLWSPDGCTLCIQDTSLEYLVLFYSLEGHLLGNLKAYSNALGVKISSWPPQPPIGSLGQRQGQGQGQGHKPGKQTLFAIGSYDQCVRLVSPITWQPVAVLRHTHPRNQLGQANVACYREVPMGEEDNPSTLEQPKEDWAAPSHTSSLSLLVGGSGGGGRTKRATGGKKKPQISSHGIEVKYVGSLPSVIPSEKPDPTRPNPRLGVGLLSWSTDGRYLATRNDNMPTALWVWDAETLGLSSLLLQMESVRSAKWSPTRSTLAVCTGNHRVYLWSPDGASWVNVPADGLEILGFRWSPDGEALLLLSKDRMCCCFLNEAEGVKEESAGGTVTQE